MVRNNRSFTVVSSQNPPPNPPPPPGDNQLPPGILGIYVPAYGGQTQIDAVILARQTYPNIPFIVSIGGPPSNTFSSSLAARIQTLTSLGCRVIGYVPTGYIAQPLATVHGWIQTWYNNYHSYGMQGVMFDEVSGGTWTTAEYNYYADVAGFARSVGFTFLRANPGAAVDARAVQLFDVNAIYETGGYPSGYPNTGTLQQSINNLAGRCFNGQYGRRFTATLHTTPTFQPAWVQAAAQYVSYVYITDDVLTNPYDVMPSYWAQELQTISQINSAV